MPSVASITINDGASTPVAHTFVPTNKDVQGAFHYADQSGGVPVGFSTISASLTQPKPGNGQVYRIRMKIRMPTLATLGTSDAGITPPPTKSHESGFSCEFLVPVASSLQERKNILAYAKNLLAHSLAEDLVADLESVY